MSFPDPFIEKGAVGLGILLAITLGGAEDTGLGWGGQAQLTATAFDQFENPIPGLKYD